jgi:hypothetical protein
MKVARASFSVLLPLFELALWAAFVAVPATLVFLNLKQLAHGSPTAHLGSGSFIAEIPREHFLWFALASANEKSHTITAVNLPGMVPEILLSLATSWPAEWHPAGWMGDTWRVVAFPFFCVPAWWFVGLGLDSLFGWRRLQGGTFLLGSIFFLLFLTLFFGLFFGISASERAESSMDWVYWGIGLWSLLFSIFPCAWLLQSRRSRVTT